MEEVFLISFICCSKISSENTLAWHLFSLKILGFTTLIWRHQGAGMFGNYSHKSPNHDMRKINACTLSINVVFSTSL